MMIAVTVVEETTIVGMDAGGVLEEEEEMVAVMVEGVVVPEAEEIGVIDPQETEGQEMNTKTMTEGKPKTLWP